jgi:hypothetical protein
MISQEDGKPVEPSSKQKKNQLFVVALVKMEDLVRKSERVEAQVDDGLKFDFDDDLAQLESKPKNSKIASAQASSTDGEKSIREANRDKLQALDMKRNEMRAKAKEAREDEAKRVVAGPESEKKSERQMQRERGHEFEENLKEKGVDPERYRRMNQTQETLESKGRKDKRKREGDTPDSTFHIMSTIYLINFWH